MNTEFNYDGILADVCARLKDALGVEVYAGSRPAAVERARNAFAVASLGGGITDGGDTYQSSRLLVSLFARDRQGGIEDTPALGALVRRCAGLFPLSCELYVAQDVRMLYSGADTLGFHDASLQVALIIRK